MSVEDHVLAFEQLVIGAHSRSLLLTDEEFATIPEQQVISKGEPNEEGKRDVNFWEPVTHNTRVTMDGDELRIFHTLRGPMLGRIKRVSPPHVVLYSPCYLDPNLTQGRIHFMPFAFAGYLFTLNAHTCFGESIPDVPVATGYVRFYELNKKGEYKLQTRGAYHHIEADVAPEAQVPSVEVYEEVKEKNQGITNTSDTREPAAIAQAKVMQQMAGAVATPPTEPPATPTEPV